MTPAEGQPSFDTNSGNQTKPTTNGINSKKTAAKDGDSVSEIAAVAGTAAGVGAYVLAGGAPLPAVGTLSCTVVGVPVVGPPVAVGLFTAGAVLCAVHIIYERLSNSEGNFLRKFFSAQT